MIEQQYITELMKIDLSKSGNIDIEKTFSYSQRFFEQAMKMKNDVLLNIARQVLKRDPTNDDAGKFSLVTAPWYEHEVVCYEDVRLGIIKHTYNSDDIYNRVAIGFEFVPDKEFA
jgi:hypothetical protein